MAGRLPALPRLSFGAPWLAAACLCGVLAMQPAQAQQTPMELRKQAFEKANRGEFADAAVDFQQLITELGKSTDSRIVASMELVYYQLGLCHFFIGEFDATEKAFDEYRKKYRHGIHLPEAALYTADSQRYRGDMAKALASYRNALRQYVYESAVIGEIYASIARCYLAEDNWKDAIEPLNEVYRRSHDFLGRNWAATMLTTAYLKNLELEKVYPLVPYLLRPGSLASRSVAFNLAALEAGDAVFAQERYREALWVYRMIYPHDTIVLKSEQYMGFLQRRADSMKKSPGNPRRLVRIQESLGELEEERKIFADTPNYDVELTYRVARGYMAFKRYREARAIFLHLADTAEPELAEEGLYLAYQCAVQVKPMAAALALGERYMDKYPAGEYFDAITLAMAQIYANDRDWPNVIRHLKRTLELHPEHTDGSECMFLLGYASFMEEDFTEALARFRRVTTDFPSSPRIADATYWAGMALLFTQNFEEAMKYFVQVQTAFPTCPYMEDSAFRTAICEYGMSNMEKADELLQAFIKTYPNGRLTAEALMMRGDIAGALAKGVEAVPFYQRAAISEDINIELYNHCMFQSGQILYDAGEFAAVQSHYEQYIKRNREGSNLPLAIYWIGMSLWSSGSQMGALQYYRAAIEKYGENAKEYGIDMILEEWVGRVKRLPEDQRKAGWAELRQARDKAVKGKRHTLALRLNRVLLFDSAATPGEVARIKKEFAAESSMAAASPAVLQMMIDEAKERGDNAFALQVARYMIATFTETDYALDARMLMAKDAIEQARKTAEPEKADALRTEAIKHLQVIRDVFATSPTAGEAMLLLGRLYLDQKKVEDAQKQYMAVLEFKDWRQLWPEALYGCGECAFAQNAFDVAGAYYERIYVMYANYSSWVVKAYTRRAECLRRLHQNDKALEVLADMISKPELAKFPETKAAQAQVGRAGGA